MNMEKSKFLFLSNGRRYITKIIEEKNPKALLNYLTTEQENLSERIKEWFENPQTTLIYLFQEQKPLKERIDEWTKKVKNQRQEIKEYKEQEELIKMNKWMEKTKGIETQQEGFNE